MTGRRDEEMGLGVVISAEKLPRSRAILVYGRRATSRHPREEPHLFGLSRETHGPWTTM